MQLFGNLLTHYHYERSQFRLQWIEQKYEVQVITPDGRADLHVEADLSTHTVTLPAGSPFANLKEAHNFRGAPDTSDDSGEPIRRVTENQIAVVDTNA
jgi:hypothetical protein